MTNNSSECGMTDEQILITNSVYTGLSAVSLIAGITSIILNRCFHQRCTNKQQFDSTMEGIFFFTLGIGCLFELFESLQWIFLLRDFAGCTVLGVIREYTMMCVLTAVACLGVHVLILLTGPKCFKVIAEEKRRRYRKLLACYIAATLTVPVAFVPWAFVSMKYGTGEYFCWLAHVDNCVAPDDVVSVDILHRLLMWYAWAVIVWLFAVVVTAFALWRYCLHRLHYHHHATMLSGVKSKCDRNVVAIVCLLAAFITSVAANGVLFVWEQVTGRSSFEIALQSAAITPLMFLAYFVIITIRHVSIIKGGSTAVASMNSVNTYESTQTNWSPPSDDLDLHEAVRK